MPTKQSKAPGAVEEFIAQVNARLKETGISISELSRRSHVARPYIHRILSGEQVPSITTAESLARVLGLKITTLDAP